MMETNKEYNFRVGDYVETASGRVGYITSITRQSLNDDGDIFYQIKADCTHNVFGKHPLTTINFDGTIEQLLKSFNRIGKYDFAKEQQPKEIEELPYCSQGWHATITDKINELVEAVNKLRSGKNE